MFPVLLMKIALGNHFPLASAEFPASWTEELRKELTQGALQRVETMVTILLAIEGILLIFDFYRTNWLTAGVDAVFIWRIAFLAFLLAFRFFINRHYQTEIRLRVFLLFGVLFVAWASLVMAEVSGDMSTYTIGVLAVAAVCPLPGRFNAQLFIGSGIALAFGLFLLFPAKGAFWLINIVATCVIGIAIERLAFRTAVREYSQRKGIERQRERVDELLYNVFPESIAASLKEGRRSIALHGEVTILFADVVGFTQLASRLLPSQLIEVLETLFGRFDQLAARHGVEKIKTIGDAYMAISGAPVPVDRQVERMADFAIDIVHACKEFSAESGLDLAMRVGIHTGPVVAGVIGSSRLCYDLWGDSVNIAQRIESNGESNTISVSEPVYFKLRKEFELEDRGVVDMKGKGPTKTYVLRGRLCDNPKIAYDGLAVGIGVPQENRA